MTTPDRGLTAADAAAYLGVSARWLIEQARSREVPHHRYGRSVRFSPADLRAIEARAAEPTIADHQRALQSVPRRAKRGAA
jgi:excisionase family DNA binding protein